VAARNARRLGLQSGEPTPWPPPSPGYPGGTGGTGAGSNTRVARRLAKVVTADTKQSFLSPATQPLWLACPMGPVSTSVVNAEFGCVNNVGSGYLLAKAKGTPMATMAGSDGRHITICPACGYPSAGLCAACIQISPGDPVDSPGVPVDPLMNTVAGASYFDPAA
jgi:hypothetical protein